MNKVKIIAQRELAAFFDSLIAYIMIILFLGLSGFFTWLSGNTVFVTNSASLGSFFSIAYWTLFFFIPALTMRMLAEEKRAGTIELLSTKAVSDWQILLGKFAACITLVKVSVLMAIVPYYITVSNLGAVDHGAVFGGYMALVCMSCVYVAIGIFASSLTDNQIVAFLLTISIGFFFHLIFEILANQARGSLGIFFSNLGMRSHFQALSRGVVDLRDLVYFFSITFVALLGAKVILSKRQWQR